jgi:DNA topoisomerase-1
LRKNLFDLRRVAVVHNLHQGFRAYYRGEAGVVEEEEGVEERDDSKEKSELSVKSKRVASAEEVERIVAIARSNPHSVLSLEKKEEPRKPPQPFITSTLQQSASAKLHLSPSKTMAAAQALFETGLITYHRTDSVVLSDEFICAARDYLTQKDANNLPARPNVYKAKESAQAAHEAIRPTNVFKSSLELRAELSQEQFQLYELIWRRAVASQCKPALLARTTIVTQVMRTQWIARGQVVIFKGYSRYWHDIEDDAVLPEIENRTMLKLKDVSSQKKQTKPSARYTEAGLIKTMDRLGIGRPSTFSSTVSTLMERGYVALEGRTLKATDMGLALDDFIVKGFDEIAKPDFTKRMEAILDQIASGNRDWQEFFSTYYHKHFPSICQKLSEQLKIFSKSNAVSLKK